ncbi:hypothetical protein MTO96_027745 [Rhipicephalus appendiculatus]
MQDVLARHPDVFKDDIDGYVGPLVHLDLEEDTITKFCKARPVPLAYEEPMEEELDRLQKQEAYPTEDSPRSDQTNGPAASEQQGTVPAPYVIALPAEASPPHDLPTTPNSEHSEAEARLDTCATQARDDRPSGAGNTKLRRGPNVIGVHLTDMVTPSKG